MVYTRRDRINLRMRSMCLNTPPWRLQGRSDWRDRVWWYYYKVREWVFEQLGLGLQ